MKHTKILTFLFLVIMTFSSCSKNDNEIDSDVLASIESPYILEALREQNITSKKDVESLTELKLTLNVSKLGDDDCKWRYNYNLHENNLLAGLNQFKSLKKLIIVLRHELNDDKTNFSIWESSSSCASMEDALLPILAQVENLPNLEEFYYSSHYRNIASIISLEVKNCPKLIRIGTANPFIGIKDYPTEEIILMDETNFLEENPSYENFEEYAGSDESGEASEINSLMYNTRIHLENLPSLASLHLFQAAIRGITKFNCPNLKKVFYFKKRGSLGTGGWLFDPALTDIEEFYFDYQYYEPFPSYDAVIFDLSPFRNLNTFYYKFFVPGGDRNSVPVGSKLRIQNGTNLQHDLKITVDFRNYRGGTFVQGDSRRLAFCLDDDITEEFMTTNILIKSRHGDEGSEVVTFSCD